MSKYLASNDLATLTKADYLALFHGEKNNHNYKEEYIWWTS